MKVYTKTGDTGFTSLIGGTRVSKADNRVEIYGTLDELNCFIGLLKCHDSAAPERAFLTRLQETMERVNCLFAADSGQEGRFTFNESATAELETRIDELSGDLPPVTRFALPGSNTPNALCNVCRAICRRAERRVYRTDPTAEQKKAAVWINRLSDYFFTLGRVYENAK